MLYFLEWTRLWLHGLVLSEFFFDQQLGLVRISSSKRTLEVADSRKLNRQVAWARVKLQRSFRAFKLVFFSHLFFLFERVEWYIRWTIFCESRVKLCRDPDSLCRHPRIYSDDNTTHEYRNEPIDHDLEYRWSNKGWAPLPIRSINGYFRFISPSYPWVRQVMRYSPSW